MAFDDTFRFTPPVDEREVFGLIGKAKKVRELQASGFEGPVAQWAELRQQRFGDTVIPRHTYLERIDNKPHRVSWVYHNELDFENGQNHCFHHIVCDCALEIEYSGTEEFYAIFGCQALMSVLNKRAWLVNATYMIDEVRSPFFQPELDDLGQTNAYHNLGVRTIAYLLEYDARHPEGWVANVMSGEHTASLLGLVLQQQPAVVRWYAELLQQEEVIDFDGETLRLAQAEQDPPA